MKPPNKPEDVRQPIIDYVATEICNLIKVDKIYNKHLGGMSFGGPFWVDKNKKAWVVKQWNPFTKIEHSKMLDGWVLKNLYRFQIRYWTNSILANECIPGKYYVIAEINDIQRMTCLSKSEPFARTTAIMKAHLKLEGVNG